MSFPIREVATEEFPATLREIPQPPKRLYARGVLPQPDLPLLTIVGSRKYSSYGKQVVSDLLQGLQGYQVGIVSGLALGIDSLAHEAALTNNLYTLAIPGGGVSDERMYPRTHLKLARRILEAGGGIMNEFKPDFKATRWSFVERNRLVAGISQATLLIEAGEKSGTLITARMAVDYNRDLAVVPGSIYSATSQGTHQFLKLGATPITHPEDLIQLLKLNQVTKPEQPSLPLNEFELAVLNVLSEPLAKDDLIRKLGTDVSKISQQLMLMEIEGKIQCLDNVYRKNL